MRTAIFLTVAIGCSLGAIWLHDHWETQRWVLGSVNRAPVYETDEYPYATASVPNRIVGYLEPGQVPKVLSMGADKYWPHWKVVLPSGQKGYIFAPDINARRREKNEMTPNPRVESDAMYSPTRFTRTR